MDFLVIAQSSPLAILGSSIPIGMAIVGLGLVIFVHELGHFLVAKACGVKCEKFYVGFDAFDIPLGPVTIPAKLFHFQWGETEYGIGILPLGGYVKMLGQDDNPQAQAEENERVKLPVHKSDVKLVSDHAEDAKTAKSETKSEKEKAIASGLAAEGLTSGTTIEEPAHRLDPRSYQAKSVWQRMAIISAGVIFNVIFAVIFATIAYAVGVPYTPAVIGDTIPGMSAWIADLKPGDQFVKIDGGGLNEHIRYQHDLIPAVAIAASGDKAVQLTIRRNGELIDMDLKPRKMGPRVGIGILSMPSLTLVEKMPALPGTPAADAVTPFAGGDKIIAVKIAGQEHKLQNMGELRQLWAQHFAEPMTFIVSRQTAESKTRGDQIPKMEEIAIDVKPAPHKHLGIVTEMGPIAAVQEGSPAAKAGLSKHDKLVSVNGKNIPDPLLLDQWLKPHWGEEVELGYERKGDGGKAELKTAKVQIRAPRNIPVQLPNMPVGSDCLGVAFWGSNVVAQVTGPVTEGDKGMKPGDVLVNAQIVPGDEKERQALEERGILTKEIDLDLDEANNWPTVMDGIQRLPPDTKVKLRYQRQDLHYVTVVPLSSTEFFNPERGIMAQGQTEIHQATSFADAFNLGLRETGESLLRVVGFLRAIFVTPDVLKNTGSFVTIFDAARSEASVGWTRLLIFLTLLSANLAVINILPIPVLDGGHLMFLAAEGIRGKPVDENLQIRLTLAGFVFLLCVMVLAFGNDIIRYSGFMGFGG